MNTLTVPRCWGALGPFSTVDPARYVSSGVEADALAIEDFETRGQGDQYDKGSKGVGPTARLGVSDGPLVSNEDDRSPLVEFGEPAARLLERRWEADAAGSFRCPVPGHNGTARLVEPDGQLRVGCCTGRWRSLAEVFAAEHYRRDVFLSQIQLATWARRLAFEAGTFHPLTIDVPDPPDLSGSAAKVRQGFTLLVGLRWADGERRPVAFSPTFASAWCKTSRATAHRATRQLLQRGVIQAAGHHKPEHGRETTLYLPGGTIVAELLEQR